MFDKKVFSLKLQWIGVFFFFFTVLRLQHRNHALLLKSIFKSAWYIEFKFGALNIH